MIRRVLRALIPLMTLLASGLSARAQQAVPRATHQIARGMTLGAGDMAGGACDSGCARPGWITRKVIAPGEALVAPAVSAPPVIIAGDSVDVEYHGAQVLLRTRGVAGASGTVGETLLVALMTGARVAAVAMAPGKVRVQ